MLLSEIVVGGDNPDDLPHFDRDALFELFPEESDRHDGNELLPRFKKLLAHGDQLWELVLDAADDRIVQIAMEKRTIRYYFQTNETGLYYVYSANKDSLRAIGKRYGYDLNDFTDYLTKVTI